MGLPQLELLKTLAAGKKSGRLHLRRHALKGYLHLVHGKMVYASDAGQSGEATMQALPKLRQADFQFGSCWRCRTRMKDLTLVTKKLTTCKAANAQPHGMFFASEP